MFEEQSCINVLFFKLIRFSLFSVETNFTLYCINNLFAVILQHDVFPVYNIHKEN